MDTQEKKVDSVGYDCKSHEKQEEAVEFISAVYDGVDAMANADGNLRSVSSEDFLRRLHAEDKDDYAIRKKSSELYNVTKGTIDGVVGSVFSDGLIASEELPDPVKKLFQDIDMCGNDIESFLRVSFTNAVRDGHSFIFVDAPPKIETDGDNATLADVAEQRPFWVNYTKDQAKNWQFDVIGGKTILSQITFEECVIEKDGMFGEKEVERRRVLRRGSYEIFEKRKTEGTNKVEWISVESGDTGLEEIPIVVIYTNKKGMLESIPPYLELARTNVVHYNALSRKRYILGFAAPKVVITVKDEEDAKKFKKINADPSRSMIGWGEVFNAKYLELEGKSLEELRLDIQEAEMRMAKMGIEKYAPLQDFGNKTAHEVSSDNQKELSHVALMAKNLEDAVEYALYFTALQFEAIQGANALVKFKTRFVEGADGVEVNLSIAYEKLTFSSDQLNFINQMVDSNKLSLKTFLNWLPQVMRLPKDYDPDAEFLQIQQEQALKLAEMQKQASMTQGNNSGVREL